MEGKEYQLLMVIYKDLLAKYGPQHWWPGETPFEVIVGAILTQSTAWSNVEKAIHELKIAEVLKPSLMRSLDHSRLAGLIRSSGYFNVKARKLKAFLEWLKERFNDDLDEMFKQDLKALRMDLLNVYGIGEETADSILLYAGNKPVFVVDAYTRRIIDRVGFRVKGDEYSDYQRLFMQNLPNDVRLFNEYHALLVASGKNCCLKKQALCQDCCLTEICKKQGL